MEHIIYIMVLMSVQCINTHATSIDQCKSSVGTNFIFGIIGWDENPAGSLRLHVTTVANVLANVRVTAPFIKMDTTYTVSNYSIIELNNALVQYENGLHEKGIEVSSDVAIHLVVFTTGRSDFNEGFLALPVAVLGNRYVAASYYPYSSDSSEILVAGIRNDTNVTLSTVIDGHVSSNLTFPLQKFETYQFKSNNDVSGSVVTSSKAVAVFSGSAGAQVPVGIGDFQYLVEQMIPTKYWATKFIVTPVYPRRYFVLKFFADQDHTEVRYYNSTNNVAVYMNKGSMMELLFGTDPVTVLANNPISVVQYGFDGDNMAGDPFMSTVQGISQFSDKYEFAIQDWDSREEDTLAITVLKNSSRGLRLNGHSMSFWTATNLSVSPPMDQYMTLFVNVSYNSSYRLHTSDGTKFGAVIYGRPYEYSAYGYPLQLSFSDKDCGNHGADFTSTPAHPKTTEVSVHSTQTIQEGKGTWCFQCDRMTHLLYCDQVQKCQTKEEVCYVQRYQKSPIVDLYRSGCIRPEACRHRDKEACFDCTVCFDCTHTAEHEDCNIVKLCHSNQACMVAKYEWGDNDFYYDMECADTQVCTTKRSVDELTKRNLPVCTHCCHSDFCNINCTSSGSIPSIVG